MKKITSLFKKKWVWLLLVVAAAIPAFASLMRSGFFPMHDDLQAFRIYEMDKCFADFQIPCRWVPDAGYQYGYPQFNYYPPLPYYVGEIIHKAGFQYIDSVKILFALGFVLSAVAMFLLVSELFGNFPGFVSGMLYTYVPYKAVDVFVRGAMSEFWALIFYPLIFWAVYKLIKTLKAKYIALLGISISLLLTTHLLMSMIFALPAAVWTIYWLIKERKIEAFWRAVLGVILGIFLAAFFILPVIFERQYAHTETMTMGYFGYLQHFVNIKRLFLSTEWGYGSSGFPDEKLNLSTGIVQWIFGLVSLGVGAFYVFIKKDKEKRDWGVLTAVLGALELLILFMMHSKSTFIWKMLPILEWLQFPWRFLTVSVFLLSLIGGIGIYLMSKFRVWVGLLVMGISVFLTYSYFVPKNWINIIDAEKFSGNLWEKQLTISIFDYLPIYAKLPPVIKAPKEPEVLEGDVDFISYEKGSDWQRGEVNAKEDSLIRVPLFDFPGMTVKIDKKVVSHINNDCRGEEFCLGLITFNIPSGQHKIEVELKDTPVRRIGNYISIISVGMAVVLLIKKKK